MFYVFIKKGSSFISVLILTKVLHCYFDVNTLVVTHISENFDNSLKTHLLIKSPVMKSATSIMAGLKEESYRQCPNNLVNWVCKMFSEN